MFGQLTSALANFCIENLIDLPEELCTMIQHSEPYVVHKEISWHVFSNKTRFASFYVRTVRNTVSDPHVILQKALAFDLLLAATARPTTPGWTYKTYHTTKVSDLIINGTYHIYGNYMAVTLWNDMRGYRLLANRLIFECTRHLLKTGDCLDADVLEQHEKAKRLIKSLQLAIFATVPQHLGLVSRTDPDKVDVHALRQSTCPRFLWTAFESRFHNPAVSSKIDETLPLTRMFGGCLLPYSLFVVDLVDLGGTDSQAEPTLHMLKTISNRMAVQQAALYAEKVKARAGQQQDLLKFHTVS